MKKSLTKCNRFDWLEFSGNRMALDLGFGQSMTVNYTYNNGTLSFSLDDINTRWRVDVVNRNTIRVDMAGIPGWEHWIEFIRE